MAVVQSALDREMLLVPVPPPGAGTARPGVGTVVPATSPTGPATGPVAAPGPVGWGPTRIVQVALAVLAILSIGWWPSWR